MFIKEMLWEEFKELKELAGRYNIDLDDDHMISLREAFIDSRSEAEQIKALMMLAKELIKMK